MLLRARESPHRHITKEDRMIARLRLFAASLVTILAVACGTSDDTPTAPRSTPLPSTDIGAGGPGPLAPPGSCGSHVYTTDGGSEAGGVTFYQSNCGPTYTAFWRVGGVLQQYNGSFSQGQAGGEDFCGSFPNVYSCVHPPFEWCEVDACCSGPHYYHEQEYGSSC